MSEMQQNSPHKIVQSDENHTINDKDSTTQSPFSNTNGGDCVDGVRTVQREEVNLSKYFSLKSKLKVFFVRILQKRPANAAILPKVHSKPNLSMLNSSSLNSNTVNPMEESILILPEHQKLEISESGKCETVVNNTSTSLRRRRTLSTNSRKEFTSNGKNTNGR